MGWLVAYKEGSGAVSARGTIGPFDTREEAERKTSQMIDRYPYWEPTSDPYDEDACPGCGKVDCSQECAEMDTLMRPDFIEHTCSITGHPHYTVNSERARQRVEEQFAQDFGCDQLLAGEIE